MNRCLKITVLLLVLFQFTSCLEIPKFGKEEKLVLSEDFNTINVNEYSIAIPKHMKVATGLNDDASLQYQNIFKEAYVVVIDEPKDELIEVFTEMDEWDKSKSVSVNYRDIQLSFLSESIAIDKQSQPKSLNINGLEAEVVEVDGRAEGIPYDIAYTLAFVEGDENVYMIMAWTLKDKKEKLRNTYKQVINSFELL